MYCYCNNDPINFADPSGHSATLTAILIGLVIAGVATGFAIASAIDYYDDGKIFNGSVAWYDYVGASALGGAIGYGIGYLFGPALTAFAGATLFSVTFPSTAVMGAGGSVALVGGATLCVTGADILTAAAAAGALILYAKGFGPRMGHNQHEKQQWDEAMKQLGIKNKDLIRRLHIEKNKYPYQDTLKGLLEVLREILSKWGKEP